MRVTAELLTPEVSITLVEDDDGWRFGAWSVVGTCGAPLAAPPEEAVVHRFCSEEDALDYFRALCAGQPVIS
jgi:hypothetical protein